MICFLRTVAFVKAFLQIGQFFIGLLVFALEPPLPPDFLSLVSLLFPSDLTLWLSLLRSDRSDVELPMKPDKVLFAGCVLFINLFCSIKLLLDGAEGSKVGKRSYSSVTGSFCCTMRNFIWTLVNSKATCGALAPEAGLGVSVSSMALAPAPIISFCFQRQT